MTLATLSYRRATSNDAWTLICIHYAAVHSIGTNVYPDELLLAWSPPPDEPRRQRIADLLEQGSTICTVAEGEALAVGFGIAFPAEGWLRALYVHPHHCNKGIGQELLRRIELECRSAGVAALDVNASHNAEAFYRRCGYEVIGPTTQTLTQTLSMSAVHMKKQFPAIA